MRYGRRWISVKLGNKTEDWDNLMGFLLRALISVVYYVVVFSIVFSVIIFIIFLIFPAQKSITQEELEQYKHDPVWLITNYGSMARNQCSTAVENSAKNDFKWMSSDPIERFPKYYESNQGIPYEVVVLGDKVQYQNGFGAFIRMSYECMYNYKTDKAFAVATQGKM